MKKKNVKLLDLIGAGCGVFLLIVLVVSVIAGMMPTTAGLKDKDIPEDALRLTGSAQGRNGEIVVEVAASENAIYQIKIIDQEETQSIGTVAVEKIPEMIYQAQNLQVDAVSGATITSEAIKDAIYNALVKSEIEPATFGGARIKAEKIANQVQTGSGVTVLSAQTWADEYPEIYASYLKNQENSETVEYPEEYPMIATLYDGIGFSKYYSSARGHFYDVTDLTSTGRPHALANCFTCKTPNFTALVNEMGDSAYTLAFEDVLQDVNEAISCYNCHANTPGEVTVTHSYLIDAVGEDFESIDAADLACGQCHVEYYFDPETKATTLPHTDVDSMSPDAILDYFNNLMVDGQPFADYTNSTTGVRQIKVQHPEFETFLGEGSPHRKSYTCADCHMGEAVSEDGTTYTSHYLTSPLNNQELIDNECSTCHEDLAADVKAVQEETTRREKEIGTKLETLTEQLAAAIESGKYSDEELDAIRSVARNAQFYWDFVFVENSEGAHNPTLTYDCLDKAEALTEEALGMLNK